MDIFLVAGIGIAQTHHVGIVPIEEQVALECLTEPLYLENQRFDLAVAVQLVTEEVQHHQRLQLQLGKDHRHVGLVHLQHQIIRFDLSGHGAVLQQQGADTGVQIVALRIGDDVVALFLKEVPDEIG